MKKTPKYNQGKFTPKFPEKYEGNVNNIFYRSGWELKFMNWVDVNSSILKWSSEETVVSYISPVDMRPHRYFLDFKITVSTNAGIKTYLVEIKPEAQTLPPKKPSRQTRRYLQEASTFMVNQAKWKAATTWAKNMGYEFIILTEKHLY